MQSLMYNLRTPFSSWKSHALFLNALCLNFHIPSTKPDELTGIAMGDVFKKNFACFGGLVPKTMLFLIHQTSLKKTKDKKCMVF